MTKVTRRRLSSSRVPTGLGTTLQELREGLGFSQVELARRAGLGSSSTVSRLERGELAGVSLELLNSLDDALDAGGALHSAAGALPELAVRTLAPYWRAVAPGALRQRTAPAVRRVHEGARAEEVLRRGSQPLARRVDVDQLARSLTPARSVRAVQGTSYGVTFDEREVLLTFPAPQPGGGAREGDLERRRFLTAHAVAHITLGHTACNWPRLGAAEVAAVDLTCHFLAPAAFLDEAMRAAVTQDPSLEDPWQAASGGLAAGVARLLAVPAWVALRRLGEDCPYEIYAEDTL